ncbi:MAG: ATP-binding protein [Candidatus Latescibacteria bacterium]|jgi:signal transduction histidine kinase|nr:ATP-binding protein [Candidatus Latescibacterota bacterium]
MSFKTRPGAMVYRYRLSGHDADWKTTKDRRVEYHGLSRGHYTFEVQAVDRDLVYSEAPATLELTVHPPYERIGLLSVLGIAVVLIGWQTARVVRRDRRLQAANTAMSEANKELFQANVALNQERAVERIRGEVQAMDRPSDFERVLSVLSEDLKMAGLSFDTCGIDVLDEPTDKPTMAYFEEHGYRCTAYTIDPDGTVRRDSYHISAPFPPVNLEMVERFVAGQPWRGRSEENAIVEVPVSGYGRLRITSSDRPEFTEDDTDALRDFASAIALGYARYLDIREIQEQTQRKSAFLASMAHDLRTPMNAIMGFTNVVLRRGAERLSERHRDNLNKVIQASDHLLAMINDLMDLSKIEAGRMDVNPEVFDVKALVTTCCATVSPLVAEKAAVALNHEVAEDVGQANTDQARLRRMVINLLSNAIKFTDAGSVTVDASKDGDDLVIAVADTGKGIPVDEIDTIFDEYRQVKGSDKEQKGTGLGLSITKKFAELLGGSIGVESVVGQGSTFTVRIPVTYGED